MNASHDKPEPAAPEAAPASAPPALDLDRAQAELESMKDRHLRLQADFDNFRKRTQRERSELALRAIEDLVRELLPVVDHFELGLKTSARQGTVAAVHDGFAMVYDQLLAVLRKVGVVPVDAHEAAFNPLEHAAVAHLPSDEYPADAIMEQTRRGYRMGDKLLRPVQVVVSSGPGAPRGDGMERDAGKPEA